MSKLISMISAAVLTLAATSLAAAKCSGTKFSFRPVDNDTISISASCDSNGIDKKQFKPGPGYEFTGVSVLKKPQNGIATAHSFGFEYKPSKGFVGHDKFSIRVCATQFGQSGCSTLNYSVEIQ